MMLKEFEKWLTEKESFLRQQGFTIAVSHSPTDINKPSLCVDLDSDDYMGRIVMWNTGECQIEIVSVETEKTLLDNYRVVSTSSEFDNVFSPFFEKLKIHFENALTAEEDEKWYEFKLGHLTLRLANDFERIRESEKKSSEEYCLYFKEQKDMLFFLSRNKLLQLNSRYTSEELLNDALISCVGKVIVR
ncbi:MAG: hypothetical protein DRR16_09780 [Candidatus Parabeggiatoa sp. nov. 3]|jgi:hypothetical protein|nr:MAG: hypothetical protein DRR00_15360 [Gammaproteobacteria bacterium]RKZ86412.1 MAG: hypothetical protein DRR16_09780 [Gammaproteobacteria bacterium]